MGLIDNYWRHIDNQLDQLRTATTADDVMRICPASEGMSSADGFFGGGGGDVLPDEPLHDAGWRYVWMEADYYWCMRGPTGDLITYIEGDLYRGDQAPLPHNEAQP